MTIEVSMPEPKCACDLCQHNHEFEVPAGLVADIMSGDVAIFAGAGTSTEKPQAHVNSFYDTISNELDGARSTLPFPDLMQRYCDQRDGRIKLVQKIREHFAHIESFTVMRIEANKFHRELATFFPIDTIITTNWDNYFEVECGATPFIHDRDMALWEATTRRVLKLHGSIENVGSLVATRSDYERSKARLETGLIGARLKSILADKTLVYAGYSFTDPDLEYIDKFVSEQLGEFSKQAYIVTLDDSPEALERYKRANLQPIITDATYFLSQIKKHAVENHCFFPDEIYDDCWELWSRASRANSWLWDNYDIVDDPVIIHCGAYQDGLIHVTDRITNLRKLGVYSDAHRVQRTIHGYIDWLKRKIAKRQFRRCLHRRLSRGITFYPSAAWREARLAAALLRARCPRHLHGKGVREGTLEAALIAQGSLQEGP